MPDIEDDVMRTFLERVAGHEDITPAVAEGLRTKLAEPAKLPTADALVQIFVDGSSDPVA